MTIAIFASGTGSNAVKIIEYFKEKPQYQFIVLSNKKDAPVLEKAQNLGIKTWTFGKQDFYENNKVLAILKEQKVDFVVLAGFLWLVPEHIVKYFPNKIINLHPALLPKHGGKGMFGHKVHEAVIQAKEKESGITIHYVNERYDEGSIIFQAQCQVNEGDTPESLANKIHALEHEHLPRVLEKLLLEMHNK
ncbi:phosphoribosylglycinamide formyltransferase [Thermoflexibacter ruber]|uniref:Phosphoribosylglycinamide formyltransferase n=1 Tax=Thermoflexibacter ruber TaxID=1003 RepID=A0A1I2GWE5_9BACT|nr:phosphoribosylglycinamide formyltransferase [Thermoflexibacter ruber]SFF21473.1 formyltetrahydrofolate-dependent phosphoribosylglycinamide formyltransferase [Thermoflexibacter ruber]